MASTYSDSLRLELIATGEKSGTWGTITNTNLGTLLESAIAGVATVSHTDAADYTLTTANAADDEARHMVLEITGTLTAARNVVCPTKQKVYIVFNNTTGGFAITIKTSGGTGVTVHNGQKAIVYCDGTNVVEVVTKPKSPTFQKFTSNGTWTRPAGCKKVLVTVKGGGGGGGGADLTGAEQASCGSGGSEGGTAIKLIDVSGISSSTITVGTGGSGNSGLAGSAGQDSVWSDGTNTLTGSGGPGGNIRGAGTALDVSGPPAGGAATGGDINIAGSPGHAGHRVRTSEVAGAATDVIALGGGGGGQGAGRAIREASSTAASSTGIAATGPGAGGGGATSVDGGGARAGGAGADGIITVVEYYA